MIGTDFVEDWFTDFDGGQGILAGAAVGYSFAGQNSNVPLGGLRVELEYFYRESKHDQSANLAVRADPRALLALRRLRRIWYEGCEERLNSITSHNLFGNVYYDFSNTSRFTPYIGIGGGVGVTEADWGATGRGLLIKVYSGWLCLMDDYAGSFANATQAKYGNGYGASR